MSTRRSFPKRHLALLLLVAGILFFLWLGRLPLIEPDEGRNAEVAREMLVSGNWITPHFNTLTYLDKPVVFFWMVAGSFRLWGVSEWAARFPSALVGLGMVLLTWFLARRMFDASTGLRAGIVLATTPLVIALARFVTFDMTLSFLVTVAMGAFWLGENLEVRPAWLDVILFGAAGVATITKGPVGFILPLLSILVYEALRGHLRDLKRLHWRLGLLVFCLAVFPWFIAVSIQNPDFPRYALWQESLLRFATRHAHRTGPVYYYIPIYLLGFFPWSFFLLFAGWGRVKIWRLLRQESRKPVLFLLAWAGTIFVFFSISQSKLPAYFLPAMVPLSILMAHVWKSEKVEGATRAPDWVTAGFAGLLAFGLLAAFLPHFWPSGAMAARMAKKLPPSFISMLKPGFLYTGLILIAFAVIGRNLTSRAKAASLSAFVLTALIFPLLTVRWIIPLKTYAADNSSRRLARTILASPEKDWPLIGYYYFRTSLPFYLRRPVGLVTTGGSEITSNYVSSHLSWIRRHRTSRWAAAASELEGLSSAAGSSFHGEPILMQPSDLRSLASRQSILVLVRGSNGSRLRNVVGPVEPLWIEWNDSVWGVERTKH